MKKTVSILLALVMLLGLCSCAAPDGDNTEERIEDMFDKTIRDFGGHMVYQLTDEEDNNFAVFQKETHEISCDGFHNVLSFADAEQGVYHFLNPDESLTGLKKGDVAYGWFPDAVGF